MKYLKNLLTFLFILLLCSCSTIHYRFENEPSGDGGKEWHHIGLFQLVEFSDPVRVMSRCKKGVHKITSRKNALQGLISLIPWVGWAWSPTEVKVECSNKDIYAARDTKKVKDGSSNKSENTNTNTININISPDSIKKKKKKK